MYLIRLVPDRRKVEILPQTNFLGFQISLKIAGFKTNFLAIFLKEKTNKGFYEKLDRMIRWENS